MALLTRAPQEHLQRRRRTSIAMRAAVCGLLLGTAVASAQVPASEYQVKAVFLFNFAQFVEWPPTAFAGPSAPMIIGVLGENPFGSYLDETVRGERVSGRPVAVQYYRRVDEIRTCHVLFISRSEEGRLDQILNRLKDRSILVVSDVDDFSRRGGMIRLATVQNRIRLVINPDAARAANLTISSQLLRSAELVTPSRR
jgi:hypothetical protein